MIAALIFLVGVAEPAKADLVVPITNASFENPSLGSANSGHFTTPTGSSPSGIMPVGISGWTTDTSGSSYGIFQPAPSFINGSVPDGSQVAYINAIGQFGQDVGAVVAGAMYTLSFSVAPSKDSQGGNTEAWAANWFTSNNATPFSVSPSNGNTGTVVDTSANGFQTVTVTATAPSNATGDLIVQFQGTTSGGGQVVFDKVSLSEASDPVSTPETSLLVMTAIGAVLGAGALWRSRLRSCATA